MNRPLLITDCDEVLLHMVAHFDAWLGEVHDIDFAFESGNFGGAMTIRLTMRLGAAAEVVAPHTPLEAAALRGRRHVHLLAWLEDLRADAIAEAVGIAIPKPELGQVP